MATPANPITGFRFEAPDPDPPAQPQQPVQSKPTAPAAKDEPDERYEALQREVEELRTSNRDLIGLVGRNAPAPKPDAPKVADTLDDIDWGEDPKDETVDEPEDPTALVDDIAKLGRDALAKRGFVRSADVRKIVREESRKAAVTAARQIVGKARTEVVNESRIMTEFPDLGNPDSDLYKATIPHVRAAALIDPGAAKNPATLYLAAKAATAELAGKKGNRSRRDDSEEDDDVDDREPVRRAPASRNVRDIRIASQSGDRNRTRSRTESGGNDDFVMDADAKQVARMMGISDDEYKAEATRVRTATGQSRRRV